MRIKNRGLVILNTVTLLLMLFGNYATNAGVFSDTTVGDISHKYDTLFAPAGYAFIIWSFIFLMSIGFVVYQWVLLKNNDPREYIKRTGAWFAVSNVANVAWVYCWTEEFLGWSVILIILLLLSLCILTIKLRLELDDEPVRTIIFIWWPVAFYLGWIMVATVACIASWLVYAGWNRAGIHEDTWAIVMIIVAVLLYLVLVTTRNMREAALVGVWAFIAIAVRQWHSHGDIALTASIAALLLLTATSIHGYRNRNYAIGAKIRRSEWQ